MGKLCKGLAATFLAFLVSDTVQGQEDLSEVEIETVTVAPGIFVLFGGGGNIAVSAGPDGVILIDDQYAPMTEKITAAVAKLSEKPVRFVLNTHWHGDHSGGNENLGKGGALIVAHDNVRERMSTEQFHKIFDRHTPASAPGALPVVTFTEAVTFHLNGEEIRATHVEHAHTDGDAIVRFVNANVVHMGDTYFNGMYPFIDVPSGGSIDGMIAAVRGVLADVDDATKIIPGHGPISNRSELKAYLSILEKTRANVARLMGQGKSLEEILEAKPNAEFDEALGGGFLFPDTYVKILFSDLSRN